MPNIIPEAARPKSDKRPQIPTMYTAQLSNADGSINLTTQLPERFPIGLATSWDTPFNQPLSDFLAGGNAARLEQLGRLSKGVTSLNKWMSGAVWTSGSVLEVSEIPFVLQAYNDAYKDVMSPFLKLLRLVTPIESTKGMLKAPGPHLLGENVFELGGEIITLRIGNFFKMSPCIIESVQGDFDTQFDEEGYPISATVSVTIKSFWSISRQDIDKMFKRDS